MAIGPISVGWKRDAKKEGVSVKWADALKDILLVWVLQRNRSNRLLAPDRYR